MINGAGKTVLKTYTVDLSKPDEELEARAPWHGTEQLLHTLSRA